MDGNNNFFNVNPIQKQNSFAGNFAEETQYSGHKINGYDSSLLNDKPSTQADKLNLEYRINEKQSLITALNGKIKNAEIYGTQSEFLSLKVRKQRLEKELSELTKQNTDTLNLRKNETRKNIQIPWLKKTQTFLSRHVLAKVSKKYNSIVFLSDSLEKLSDISKNVDALVDMKVPYGEKNDNYEKLTEYLSTANKIHSEISKTIGK